jgi:hypothetical protein
MAAARKKLKTNSSFTTWKINLENTINADPLADGECLQIVRAYLDWMGSADARPYRSLLDLRVATSLSENTIIDRRRRLVKLGYFVVDGNTSDGATRYRIVNSRENIVLDHQTEARETLRRLEAEKKEKSRDKRRFQVVSPSPHEGLLSPSRDEGQNSVCPLAPCGDSPSPHEGNYVYNSVEAISMEEEDIVLRDNRTPTFSSSSPPDEANMPLPKPRDDEEAERIMASICEGVEVHPSIRRRMLGMLHQEILTPHMAAGMTGKRKEDAA